MPKPFTELHGGGCFGIQRIPDDARDDDDRVIGNLLRIGLYRAELQTDAGFNRARGASETQRIAVCDALARDSEGFRRTGDVQQDRLRKQCEDNGCHTRTALASTT